ncbi:MAG: hypothetical protein ABIR66_11805 [Saprospiraceae bacterium]
MVIASGKPLGNTLLKLLLNGDSYAYALLPWLHLQFEEVILVSNHYFMPELIEKEKPDIVILESLERLLSYNLSIPNPTK